MNGYNDYDLSIKFAEIQRLVFAVSLSGISEGDAYQLLNDGVVDGLIERGLQPVGWMLGKEQTRTVTTHGWMFVLRSEVWATDADVPVYIAANTDPALPGTHFYYPAQPVPVNFNVDWKTMLRKKKGSSTKHKPDQLASLFEKSAGTDLILTELKIHCPGLDAMATCPAEPLDSDEITCNQRAISSMVIHLNDKHQWTREQIADWLDTLDVDLSFKDTDSPRLIDYELP